MRDRRGKEEGGRGEAAVPCRGGTTSHRSCHSPSMAWMSWGAGEGEKELVAGAGTSQARREPAAGRGCPDVIGVAGKSRDQQTHRNYTAEPREEVAAAVKSFLCSCL